MITYKNSLILMLSIASMSSIHAMKKDKKNKNKEAAVVVNEDAAVHEWINKLMNFETDSVVIQEGKTILTNDDYNDNPVLLAAYASFYVEFKCYKKGRERYYNMFTAKNSLGTEWEGDPEGFNAMLFANIDSDWKKEAKEIKKSYDQIQIRKKMHADFGSASKKNNGQTKKEVRTEFSSIKKWMQAREFRSTKFYVDVICKQMGIIDDIDIEQEKTKIIELLHKYDNK
jgi:hypothetical protein